MSKAGPGPDVFRGRRVGKYEVLTRLSIGGMAELFLAYTSGPGGFRKFVALKQILPDIASDEAFVRMFLDEARITASLNHPNVGQVYELGEAEGQFYLALEYIAGQNLEHIIRRAARRGIPLPVGFSVKVIRDLCLGLHYAHSFSELGTGRSAGIVHRDISPKNIMVTYGGTVKVVDFGIAKARNRLIHTKIGMVKGTSGYMSPEQVRSTAIDGRTDLFASSIVLYELLTGQRLFSANTDLAMMRKITEEEIPHPQKLNPGLSKALSAVILKGLERNVRERFQNGREMARALEKAYPNLADEDKTASVMSELFPDRMSQSQALMESASIDESHEFYQAVRALAEPAEASKPSPRRRALSSSSSSRREPVAHKPEAPVQKPSASKPARKRPASPPAPLAAKQHADDMEDKTPVSRHIVHKPSTGKRKKGWLLALAVLALAAGGLWAVGWGPLHKPAEPYVAKIADWVEADLLHRAPAPAPTEEEAVDSRPAWWLEREAEEERKAEEKRVMDEYARRLDSPEFKKLLNDIDEQTRQLWEMEEEQRTLKAAQTADRLMGRANTKRIDELERRIESLTKKLQENQKTKARMEGKPIQVLADQKEAEKAGVGYFSLSTQNPVNAKVYFKNKLIGTTPLQEVPLEQGMQEFHLEDLNGQRRLLVFRIAAGKKESVAINIKELPLVSNSF